MANSENGYGSSSSWKTLARDLEERIESLTRALDEIRFVVQQLTVEAASAGVEPSPSFHEPARSVFAPPDATPSVWEGLDYTLPPVDAGWSSLGPVPDTPAVPAAREEVTGPAGSQPIPLANDTPAWPEPAVSWQGPATVPASVDDDPVREEVRRAVERMRAEMESGAAFAEDRSAPVEMTPPEPAPTVIESTLVNTPSSATDTDALRDEVRRAVEAARREISEGSLRPETAASAWSATPAMPVEPVVPSQPVAPLPPVELPAAGPTAAAMVEPPAPPVAIVPETPAPPAFDYQQAERGLAMPSIIIEDPQGRVELVRVYETLSRVNRADQAVLLNYTPHSVTVGLGSEGLPAIEALKEAVSGVFGRGCQATSDGYRISVVIANAQGRAA
jgi:hypothetical protein